MLNLKNKFDILDKHQIKTKSLENNIQIKTESLINNDQIKSLDTQYQSADYLIEYFEGIMLNYIKLYESQGKRMDKLKNLILGNKNIKIKGGDKGFEYIKNHVIYKYYYNDNDNDIPLKQFDNNWGFIDININIDYQKEYIIHITHEKNGSNKIDLIIDLQHNVIINNIEQTYNDDICGNTKNITYILETITKKLIEYEYNITNLSFNELFYLYGKNKDIDDLYTKYRNSSIPYKGIISLLIIILTLRNNTDENTYKKYNTTFLLSDVYEKILISRSEKVYCGKSFDMFNINNNSTLTYSEKENSMNFGGDCALNVLMAVENADIRELFVDKIGFSQNKFVKEEKKIAEYYINKINKVLDELPIVEGFGVYKENTKDFVNKYNKFVNFINNDYSDFKNTIINNDYKKIDEKYHSQFETMYHYYLQFINVIRNNLIEYELKDENEIEKIFDGSDRKIMKLKGLYDNEDYTAASRELVKLIDKITKYKYSFNTFNINLLISLLLIKHKINYLFDNNIIKILKYSKNKINIIKCFRNTCKNKNELGFMFPRYQKGDDDADKYLFIYVVIAEDTHAALLIININKIIRSTYLYDMNDLVMYCEDPLKIINTYNIINDNFVQGYFLNNRPKRWIYKVEHFNISKYYYEKYINILFLNIYSKKNIINSLRLNTMNIFDNEGYINFIALFELSDEYYNNNNFNLTYFNIKREIFEELLDYCDRLEREYQHHPENDFLFAVHFINYYISNNIINPNNDIKSLLFKFIDCLIECKYNIYLRNNTQTDFNLENEYKIIAEYLGDTYLLKIKKLRKYLKFITDINDRHIEFKRIIRNTIKKINFDIESRNIVYGGNDVNTNCCNSVVKKILIILLIVVIVIIIVLIILYIINKYKNKNNLK